jgi:polyamine oxidase
LGDNPINQLAHKYKLNTAPTDGDDVVFYNDSGKIDHSSVYKKFNDDYEKMSDFACKLD